MTKPKSPIFKHDHPTVPDACRLCWALQVRKIGGRCQSGCTPQHCEWQAHPANFTGRPCDPSRVENMLPTMENL